MSTYLQSADYANFGLPTTTTPAQVQAASANIDAYLKRPEGLLVGVDGNGAPAYMLGAAATGTLACVGAVAPGTAVAVQVTGFAAGLLPGDALLLDSANPAITEVAVVLTTNGNVITFANIQFNHAAGAIFEVGRFIMESRAMPKQRPITTLSRYPVANLLSGRGRYGYGRRGSTNEYNLNDFNLLAAIQRFGGPPVWESFSVGAINLDAATGRVWVPAGILLAYYSEVNIYYVAGFTQTALPVQIKQACANLVEAATNAPETPVNAQSVKAGTYGVTMFNPSLFDDDTRRMLDPYRLRDFR